MKEREKEAEADARDRHKEKEEMEELRKKLVEEGHPDPDSEIGKRQNPDSTTQPEEDMDTTSQEPAHHAVSALSWVLLGGLCGFGDFNAAQSHLAINGLVEQLHLTFIIIWVDVIMKWLGADFCCDQALFNF